MIVLRWVLAIGTGAVVMMIGMLSYIELILRAVGQ